MGGLGLETGGASWAVWRPKGKTEGGVVEALARVRPAEGHHTCHAYHTWMWGALGALTQSTHPGSPLRMEMGGWRAFQQESEPCGCASNCYPRAPPDLWGQNLPRRHWASVRSGQQGMRSTHRSQVSCKHSPHRGCQQSEWSHPEACSPRRPPLPLSTSKWSTARMSPDQLSAPAVTLVTHARLGPA